MAADKMLADHERAHTGKPGMKPRHGQDAIGRPGRPAFYKPDGPIEGEWHTKPQQTNVYQRLRTALDKGLDGN